MGIEGGSVSIRFTACSLRIIRIEARLTSVLYAPEPCRLVYYSHIRFHTLKFLQATMQSLNLFQK